MLDIIKKRKGLALFSLFLIISVSSYVWWVHFNYRFAAITDGKVFKSGAMPPQQAAEYAKKYNIKTIIDLREPKLHDELNPGTQDEIDAEHNAIAKIEGIDHINIASGQIPTKETLQQFFEVLDDPKAYPVWIHCHHGTGRAMLYSALYRIEYENFSNEDARSKTRVYVPRSSFAEGRSKGDFLIKYKPRKLGKESTLNSL
ncbi:MAG: dual specificity protein phosphatase family protein [Gammaproteobacteria bacterium]|nr:dual specificity protein phosphatase family protein [Gammaproteobacteria bacterium]